MRKLVLIFFMLVASIPFSAVRMGLVALTLGACASSLAQDYPTRPIHIVVGFSPGSTTDILARTVGQKMHEAWGQPVVVDNRPTAGGIAASSAIANAAPDGYTLPAVFPRHAATAAMFAKRHYA